ncbi:UDP-glycosyltransferase 86A1-like protein [Tanacetum coccineum]
MSNRRTENPHAIFIPFPLQGHLIPPVLLATKLASNGFTVTFVNTESIHHSITKSSSQSTHDVFADACKSGLDIRYATVSDGLPVSLIDKCDEVIDYIPGVESIRPRDMMSYLQATNTDTVSHRIIHKALFQDARHADFIVCNTVQELEPHTIFAFNEIHHFYVVGSIFSNEFTQELVSTSLWSELHCTNWLDKKPPNSVLYVSFGSYAHISKHELQEIAFGLLQSGVSFVWALRPDIVSSDETNALPIGFEDDVRDRGLIVPWCNQKTVISHPSIGGFLIHCGWNSILESIWCGVLLVCFPLLTDQFTNSKLVVDDWKIGINLCEGNLAVREEVSKKVTNLMMGEKSNKLRVEINKVKRTLNDSLAMGGSSQRNFDEFFSVVKVKIDQLFDGTLPCMAPCAEAWITLSLAWSITSSVSLTKTMRDWFKTSSS